MSVPGISFGGTPAASSVDVEIDRVDEMLARRAAAHVDVERVRRRPTRPWRVEIPYFSLNIYATLTIWAGPVGMD